MPLVWLLIALVVLGLAIQHWQVAVPIAVVAGIVAFGRRSMRLRQWRDEEKARQAAHQAWADDWLRTVFQPGPYTVQIRKYGAYSDEILELLMVQPGTREHSPEERVDLCERIDHIGPQAVAEGIAQRDAIRLKTELETRGAQVRIIERGPASPQARRSIPQKVREDVWRRDDAKCVDCGSRERLEYDHIVPLSRGGSNTARNIELRCETCNRRKGASI